MKKSDFIEDPSGFKAVNAFIFAGSFSLGVMKAGFDLEKVLEISDDQPTQNAYYFIKNVTDVPVILPSEWENDAYLDNLKNENIDLMCCNCPCSSLSQINRNASVDGRNNVHFYRLFNIFEHVQPKVFVIENAPTLIKLGFPILRDMAEKLGDKYRFSIIRDFAANHNVPMKRQRTMVVGWNRDHFKTIPFIQLDAHPYKSVKDTIGDNYDDETNDFKSPSCDKIAHLYHYAKNTPGSSFLSSLAIQIEKDPEGIGKKIIEDLQEYPGYLKEVNRIRNKIQTGGRWWDKTPVKLNEDKMFPSFTSVTEYLHPTKDRMLNLKELGRIMGYPDNYSFTNDDGKCTTPVLQGMAQGVPVEFGRFIARQARLGLEGKLKMNENPDVDVVFQHQIQGRYNEYTLPQFKELQFLDTSKESKFLDKE